jgi:hypothetical protein
MEEVLLLCLYVADGKEVKLECPVTVIIYVGLAATDGVDALSIPKAVQFAVVR